SPESIASSIERGPASDSASAARSSARVCAGTGAAGARPSLTRRGARSRSTSRVARRNSSSSGGDRIQILLRVERSHATGPRARHGLPVDVILDVAGGEHALHAGCGGKSLAPAVGDDVAVFHLELA